MEIQIYRDWHVFHMRRGWAAGARSAVWLAVPWAGDAGDAGAAGAGAGAVERLLLSSRLM